MVRRRTLVLLAGLAAGSVFALLPPGPRGTRAAWPPNLGHRGDSVRFPENTLAAFRGALEAGAGGLELDVRITRDGHPVVMHDPTVDRTTNGFGAVSGMTLAEVRRLNAGRANGTTEKVPTLREVLAKFPNVPVNLDIKDHERPGAESVVLDVLRGSGAAPNVLVASSHHGVLRRFRRLAGGEVATGASRVEIAVFLASSSLRLERLLRPAYVALQVPVEHRGVRILTRRFVQAAHSVGVRVDVWTINDAAQMREVLDLGADSVMTDDPGLLDSVGASPLR